MSKIAKAQKITHMKMTTFTVLESLNSQYYPQTDDQLVLKNYRDCAGSNKAYFIHLIENVSLWLTEIRPNWDKPMMSLHMV